MSRWTFGIGLRTEHRGNLWQTFGKCFRQRTEWESIRSSTSKGTAIGL
jgi:hypothetical protein